MVILKIILACIWKAASILMGLFLRKKNLYVPILCYHSVHDILDAHADPLSLLLFENHVRYLSENHTVISLKTFTSILTGETIAPENPAVITFDDGYKDNYINAYPILKKYNVGATFFIVSDFINNNIDLIGRPEWEPMSWDDLKAMNKDPLVEIGAHTHTHALLATLDDQDARNEIRLSKEIIEEKLETGIDVFAYPNGQGKDISPVAKKYVEELGFICACSTIWNTQHRLNQKYFLNRVMVSGADTLPILKAKLRGDYNYIYIVHKVKALVSTCLSNKGIWR